MPNNYIQNYSKFRELLEQDMGMPAMPGMPGAPGEAAPPKKEKPFYFIFIDDMEVDGLKKKKFPDGSIEVDFPTYSVNLSQIEDWTKKNILSTDREKMSDSVLDLRRKNLIEIIKGDKINISNDDIPFIEKLKNAVSTDIFGTREPDTTVVFTKEGAPTTEDIKVTFVKYKK